MSALRSASRIILAAGFALAVGSAGISAQISQQEFAARRDSLAARIDSGIVIAFGGRTPVSDFGPFFQLPAFHYLTSFDEPDATLVLVVRNGRVASGAGALFVTPAEPRSALY